MAWEDVTVLVYAGGQATRMGRVNKARVAFRGRPLMDWVVERLRPQGGSLLISANRDADWFASRYGAPVLPDLYPGFPGPLGALDAVAQSACPAGGWILTAPCDAPFVPLDLGERLLGAMEAQGAPGAFVFAGDRPQSTFSMVRRSLLSGIRPFLDAGGRKLSRWLRASGAVPVIWPDAAPFLNLNAPEDILEAQKGAGGQR